MSRKKQYKNRLPTVLPPAPRPAPAIEALPPAPPPEPSPTPRAAEPAVERSPTPQAAESAVEPHHPPLAGPSPRSRTAVVAIMLVGPLVAAIAVLLATSMTQRGETGPAQRGPDPTTAQELPGAARDESYVEARVEPDGEIVVQQWIRSKLPLRNVVLALPEVPDVRLSAAGVQVVADDRRAAGPRTITDGEATYSFEESTDIWVRYRLVGAVLRSESATGRALAVATTLDVSYSPQPTRETRVIRAPEVLSLACTASSAQAPEPCGSAEGSDQWRVDLTGPRVVDRVIAQLTLEDETPSSAADAR